MSTAKRIQQKDFDDKTMWLLDDPSPEAEIEWIETFLSIESEQGEVVDFILYPQQRQMAHNRTGRDLTVKGRQTRASSFILARNLRRMTNTEGLKCLVMCQNDQTTATFRARIKHHLKDLAQHGMNFDIALDNEDELVIADMESRYIFGSGEERVAGRAYTASVCHLSEISHWHPERASSLMGAIGPSVPGPPFGQLDIESTPNGAEGQFYDMIMGSKLFDPMSRWSTHFYPWWLEPRYRAGTTVGVDHLYPEKQWAELLQAFKPTAEEEKLMEEAGLDVGQIIWRRVKKAEQDKTDAPFSQEFPESIEGCFITAGGNYFATPDGINHLEQYRQMAKPPIETKESLTYRNGSVSFLGPNLQVWQTPQAGQPYVVWVDCAGGGLDEQADYSAVVVLNAVTLMEVARLNIKVAPQELAPMAVAIASYYNQALLGGERDAFGSVCLSKIQELYYRNLWYYLDPARPPSPRDAPLVAWGHPTQIRNHILNALRAEVFSHRFTTFDALLLQQMGSFTWQKVANKRETLKAAAKRGQKDDLVMCAAGCVLIAAQVSIRYNSAQTLKKDETVIVGQHGVVLGRSKGMSGVKPWLR